MKNNKLLLVVVFILLCFSSSYATYSPLIVSEKSILAFISRQLQNYFEPLNTHYNVYQNGTNSYTYQSIKHENSCNRMLRIHILRNKSEQKLEEKIFYNSCGNNLGYILLEQYGPNIKPNLNIDLLSGKIAVNDTANRIRLYISWLDLDATITRETKYKSLNLSFRLDQKRYSLFFEEIKNKKSKYRFWQHTNQTNRRANVSYLVKDQRYYLQGFTSSESEIVDSFQNDFLIYLSHGFLFKMQHNIHWPNIYLQD